MLGLGLVDGDLDLRDGSEMFELKYCCVCSKSLGSGSVVRFLVSITNYGLHLKDVVIFLVLSEDAKSYRPP